MIEIKKEDIGFACTIADEPRYGYELIIDNLKTQKNCKQLKQQILQDHEDAKKLERVDSLFADLKIPPPYDLWLANSLKDRQIIESLKKIAPKWQLAELEDILEGKK